MSWNSSRQFDAATRTNAVTPQPTRFSNHQQLYNGAAKNEFRVPAKQTNLSNLAVSRMLKENDTTGVAKKEVVWPPPPEDTDFLEDSPNGDDLYSNSHQHSKSNSFPSRIPTKTFEPPPTYIPLRSSPPIVQTSPPVYKAQPAADSYQGGERMRGDQKWPPPEYKEQAEAENRARLELVRGPQFRPLKVKKDYRPFFAKNAIPNTYPGYKAPPGTQHYTEESD